MDFRSIAKFGSYISKDYAENLFRLLVTYKDISASEAASRLDLHIKTVQDFLDAMVSLDILHKEEVYEKKRPYYRYSLHKDKIDFKLELSALAENTQNKPGLNRKIRERKNADVIFTTARNNNYLSNVIIRFGVGREKTDRKINLTIPQGKFLFNLPFPNADFQSISSIIRKAGVDSNNNSEILDIVDLLINYNIIETEKNKTSASI